MLIMQMRREMKMLKKKNDEEITTLKKKNTRMKQKLNRDPTIQETIEGERPQTKNIYSR